MYREGLERSILPTRSLFGLVGGSFFFAPRRNPDARSLRFTILSIKHYYQRDHGPFFPSHARARVLITPKGNSLN
jgi:hypothetical protein